MWHIAMPAEEPSTASLADAFRRLKWRPLSALKRTSWPAKISKAVPMNPPTETLSQKTGRCRP